MAPPFHAHMTQKMTYWERAGAGFLGPILFDPTLPTGGVRWGQRKERRFGREAERKSAPEATAILHTPVKVGSCVALGEWDVPPEEVATVHEVIEYRETKSLLDNTVVKRLIAKPLLGQMFQQVTIFPMVREETALSYDVVRSSAIYDGIASVDMLPSDDAGATETTYANSKVLESQVVVTVPYSAGVDFSTRYEIDWSSPFGPVTLESKGPIFNNSQSPFWRSLNCTMMQPRTSMESA